MNCTAEYFYVMLMAKCMCTRWHHPLKLLPIAMSLLCGDSSQPGWFYIGKHMRVLGLLFITGTLSH